MLFFFRILQSKTCRRSRKYKVKKYICSLPVVIMNTICSILSNVCFQNSESNGNVGDSPGYSTNGSPNVPTFEEKFPDENKADHHHDLDNSVTRKITADRTTHLDSSDNQDRQNIHVGNVKELVAYFFLILLLIFYVFLWIRCIRIALDPYNSAEAGEQWMEIASTNEMKNSPELQFQASLRKKKSTGPNPLSRSCEQHRVPVKAKSI